MVYMKFTKVVADGVTQPGGSRYQHPCSKPWNFN